MRIVFLGTPDFAVPSLDILVKNNYTIPAVVTAPDKPGGRRGLQQSAVKKYALEHNIPVLQPPKLKNPDFLEILRGLKADLQVVVAFRMLPEVVWNMPPMGTLNLHGSLLPKYRGAAPINWAIINGERETGVTTFLLKHEIDTGDLLFQERIPIEKDDDAGSLYERMKHVGAQLVLRTVKALEKGEAKSSPQDTTLVSHAPKIFTETCRIDFKQSSESIHNLVRGLSPHPGAWTTFENKTLKVFKTIPEKNNVNKGQPGDFFSDGKHYLRIRTGDGFIQVLELQLEGKRRMSTKDFLNGTSHAWESL